MNLIELLLPFEEFSYQVNQLNIKGDIDLIQKYVLKSQFKTWQGFLRHKYDFFLKLINIDAVLSELVSFDGESPRLSGDIELLICKHMDLSLLKKERSWIIKLKLIQNEVEKLENFENELLILFTRLQLNYISKDQDVSRTVQTFFRDLNLQLSHVHQDSLNPSSYLESISMPNMNNLIQNLNYQNFYFPNKCEYLKTLQEALVNEGLIEENKHFEQLFREEFKVQSKLNPIIWKASITQLLYLLYKLNDNKAHYQGYPLSKIAFDLFKFKSKNATQNSLKVNFNEAEKRFTDKDYIERNMKPITKIIELVGF